MTKTKVKLWDKLKEREINGFCSDYWKSYCEFIPDYKHIQSKVEIFTVEGTIVEYGIILQDLEEKQNVIIKQSIWLKNL